MTTDFGCENFDVAITLDVLSQAAVQTAFIGKVGSISRLAISCLRLTIGLSSKGTIPFRLLGGPCRVEALLLPQFAVWRMYAITAIANHAPAGRANVFQTERVGATHCSLGAPLGARAETLMSECHEQC